MLHMWDIYGYFLPTLILNNIQMLVNILYMGAYGYVICRQDVFRFDLWKTIQHFYFTEW